MTERLDSWMTAYRIAWQSNRPDDIRSLFTEDARYRSDPWVDPWTGHESIVANWIERKDEPGETAFDWSALVESGDVSVIEGTTAYRDGPVYSNLWVIRFGEDGRANEFTEWWMDQSRASNSDS